VITIVVLTSSNRHESAIASIDFDPVDWVSQQPLGEMEHQVLYLSPKHLTPEVPEPYYEWLRAIGDSLDEQVEESEYHNTAILKVFELIQRDGLTAIERTRMKDEYSWEEVKQEEYAKGRTQGRAEGLAEGEAQGLAKGLAEGEAQGLAKGLAEGRQQMWSLAKKFLQQQLLDVNTIAAMTGFTVAELDEAKASLTKPSGETT
jgi:flagellar biosynthesis/type III secretory pathway protein FliH